MLTWSMTTGLGEIQVIVSPSLPLVPSVGEDAVRMVRHGLKEVLEWMNEDVGPKPGQETHMMSLGNGLVAVSSAVWDRMQSGLLKVISVEPQPLNGSIGV